jgi:uncharacterized Tic20 family protein
VSDIGPGPEGNRSVENPSAAPDSVPTSVPSIDKETRQWAMFIHFSLLAGWVIPLAGLIVPILLWQMKKDELPGIVPHAHIVMNWMVTSLVYAMICFVLTLVLIGIFGFIALAIASIVFAIMGGLKANEGIVWEYPWTIVKIFK